MKRRQFIIAAVLAGALIAGFASQALAHGGKGQRGFSIDKRVEKMTQKLDLTDEQASQVRSILEGKKEAFTKIREQNLERDQKRAQMHELRQSTRQEIARVLNDEQKAKMKKFKKRRHHKRGQRGGPLSEKRIDKMAKHLELNDDQVAKIKSIADDARAERELILEASDGDRRAARPELKAHRQKVRARIEGVMTAEQVEKAREFRKNKRKGRKGQRHDG